MTDTVKNGKAGLYSVGHSSHPFERFLELLSEYEIEVVADVRTSPYSRYSPQFDQRDLRYGLREVGLHYMFLGKTLGGRPEGDRFYDSEGHISYGRVAKTDWFRLGLNRLREGGAKFRTAMLCSEEDPKDCHRFLLVTRALHTVGEKVSHIRGDGSLQSSRDISAFDPEHRVFSLFGEEVKSSWRSTRSALPRRPLRTSSRS